MRWKPGVVGALAVVGTIACGKRHTDHAIRAGNARGYFGLPVNALEYRGSVELRGPARDSLLVEVRAHNATADSIVVQMSMCGPIRAPFTVRVYGPRRGVLRRRGRAVWTLDGWEQAKSEAAWKSARAERARRAEPGAIQLEEVVLPVCRGGSYAIRLAPGGERSIGTRSIAVRDVLGDSLPSRRYRITAMIDNMGRYVKETDAGDADLRRADPMGR